MASVDKFRTKPTRLYSVRVGFPNPNADYTTQVHATNRWNAYWRVQCALNEKRSGGIATHVNGKDVLSFR